MEQSLSRKIEGFSSSVRSLLRVLHSNAFMFIQRSPTGLGFNKGSGRDFGCLCGWLIQFCEDLLSEMN